MSRSPSYHPRPRRRSARKIILGVLLGLTLLLGLGCALFLVFFRGFVTDTPEGPRLQLPLLAPQTQATPAIAPQEGLQVEGEKDSRPTPPKPLQALALSITQVEEGSALDALEAAGATALLLPMRDETGALAYVSRLEAAIESGASAASPQRNEAIKDLLRSDYYAIAQVSCFPDRYLAESHPALCLPREGGVPYRDKARVAYLAPTAVEVQDYLAGIFAELAQLGFDEVLLADCAYPAPGGFVGAEDRAQLAEELTRFYEEARRTAAAVGLRFSLTWEAEELPPPGDCAANGQSLAALLPLCERVAASEEQIAAFLQQGTATAAGLFVPVLQEKPSEAASSWLLFLQK